MEVAIHDPNRVSSPEDNGPDLAKGVNGTIRIDGGRGPTELKRHRIKLGHGGQMRKSEEPLLVPTVNDIDLLRSQSGCRR